MKRYNEVEKTAKSQLPFGERVDCNTVASFLGPFEDIGLNCLSANGLIATDHEEARDWYELTGSQLPFGERVDCNDSVAYLAPRRLVGESQLPFGERVDCNFKASAFILMVKCNGVSIAFRRTG